MTVRRAAIGRIIGLVIAITGTGLSVNFAHDALKMSQEVHQWNTARPLQTTIDLSQPGELTVPFHQTCSASHGEALYLKLDLDEPAKQDSVAVLQGLAGSIRITDAAGNEVETIRLSDRVTSGGSDDIMLADIPVFATGDYVALIRIETGAPALAGQQQTIYARYMLCGLEHLPAQIAGFLALGTGIMGVVAAGCVLPGLLRAGFCRDAVPVSPPGCPGEHGNDVPV